MDLPELRKTREPVTTLPTETQLLGQAIEAAAMFGVVLERSNTGGLTDARGHHVRFGVKGDPDLKGTLPGSGRSVRIELKRPGFDPAKLRGKAREHFARQIERMAELNARGEACWWACDVADVVRGLEILRDDPAAQITFDPDQHPRFTYREA